MPCRQRCELRAPLGDGINSDDQGIDAWN